ncbi:uncharacterized protein [Clytia hemisphaerica]|uniref:Homeobox domain-containing protein n=1 Tax=Clytia hemisphaerica TaxID=252671 RepID=A0A7M5UY43_9CNID
MSKDILVLNDAGEEVMLDHGLVSDNLNCDNQELPTPACRSSYSKAQRSGNSINTSGGGIGNKKGFRIDDILFSVSNNVLRSTSCLSSTASNNGPMPSSEPSLCSSSSSHGSSPDQMSPVLYLQDDHPNTSLCGIDIEKQRHPSIDRMSPTMLGCTRSRSLSPTLVHPSPTQNYSRLCPDAHSLYSPSLNDAKKPRTSFSPDQIQALEDSFQEKRYLNHTERMILADELNLTDCQIKTWFQNRRMKMKRQYKEAVDKGYLIPYHPYPFPRYSRLTPAHFASLPALNARRYLGSKQNTGGRPYHHSSSCGGGSGGCHCCSTPRSYPSPRSENFPSRTSTNSTPCSQAECTDLFPFRSRRGPEVLPSARNVERRDMQYESDFQDYFRQLPSKHEGSNSTSSSERSKKYV